MGSTSKTTLDLPQTETSTSNQVQREINERPVDVGGIEPKLKLDLKSSGNNDEHSGHNPATTGDNKKDLSSVSAGSRKRGSDFYVIPLNTPTAYQNYVGSILDPTVIKAENLTWKQRFRFLICTLAIFSFSICLASRMALNIAINEMAQGDYSDDTLGSSHIKGVIPMEERIEHIGNSTHLMPKQSQPISQNDSTVSGQLVKYEHEHGPNSTASVNSIFNDDDSIITTEQPNIITNTNRWTPTIKHMLMGAFYLGYFPVMLISGYLADLYGAKTSLFLAAFGSGAINILTPFVVNQKELPIIVLIILRIALGALQAPVVPSLYALCNMWLSKTEMGIFASFIKVSMGLGVLFGYLIPGIVMMTGYGWPAYFYSEGIVCILWSVAWFLLATSKPQDNRFVQLEELRWILRKKPAELKTLSLTIEPKNNNVNSQEENEIIQSNDKVSKADRSVISHILRHPSVWALAITKLTHNIGIDFVLIEFPSFMNQAHGVELNTIIVIACTGALSLVLLVSFIGWISKVVVQRKCFGLTKTVWRKVFQGIANFGIASMLFIFASCSPSNNYVICFIVIMLNIFYMFGAGGEAVAANDMSIRYPATIYGFAHSISALGGLMVPGLAALVLGSQPKSHERWTIYFYLLATFAALGGFVFIFLFKSKLFLPCEINDDKANNQVASKIKRPISTRQ